MAKLFSEWFPHTRLRIRDGLVVSGKRREFAMGGASASWHDMLLYVVSRFSNPDIARALAKFLLINWH